MWLTAPKAASAPAAAGGGETIVRVTALGDGRIHTGLLHPSGIGALRFTENEEFPCPTENVALYLERRWIVIPTDSRPRLPAPDAHAVDREAISRLMRRCVLNEATGCLVWQGAKMPSGYGNITYRRQLGLTHRLSWIAHRGPIPPGMFVCHTCDNRACVEISHLFLGTPRDNYHDMKRKGRVVYRSKLKRPDVEAIKQRLARGEAPGIIARDHGVLPKQIWRIRTGRSWRDVAVKIAEHPTS